MSKVQNPMQAQVEEFHRVYECPIATTPQQPNDARLRARLSFIAEEFLELIDECLEQGKDTMGALSSKNLRTLVKDFILTTPVRKNVNLVEVADALGDTLYVVFGTAIEFGINMAPVHDEIHMSNLSKLDAEGKPLKDATGKVLKGPNFYKPNLSAVLKEQGWDEDASIRR